LLYVDTPEGELKLTFYYSQDGKGKRARRITRATLQSTADELATYWGESVCHSSDRFEKETGRKKALTRAVEFLDKPTRTAIWQAYHSRKGVSQGV
jgi:hypothetical protein